MTLLEEIRLPNGLVAEIWDGSRLIAADTTTVVLVVKIPVDPEGGVFRGSGSLPENGEGLRFAACLRVPQRADLYVRRGA